MAGEIVLTLIGNVTADPETRSVGNATVANFTVASTPRVFNRETNSYDDGQATFIRCSAWRELADHVMSSITKGTRVIVQGRFSQRSYQDREGNQKTSFELEVDEIGPSLRFATATVERQGRNANQARRQEQGGYGAPSHQGARQQPAQQQPAQGGWGAGAYDDETPF